MRVQLFCNDASRTQQNFKDQVDINLIMKRWLKTGVMPVSDVSGLYYGDFTGDNDYMSLSNKLIRAEESFMNLPAQVRKRFDNNPAELLAFVSDKANLEEAISLGLVVKQENGNVSPASGVESPEQSST